MVSLRLVRLIEDHADELAEGLIERLRHSSRTVDFLRVPEDELRQNAVGIYRNLGDWLLTKTDTDIETRYLQTGMRRAEQGVALADFVWGLVITKENLWSFLQSHAQGDGVLDLHGQLEFVHLVDRFYDRVLYFVTLGYQRTERAAKRAA
jgi:hypothetical protein